MADIIVRDSSNDKIVIGTGALFSGPAGKDGERGAPFRYEDFTSEQLEELKGEKGDPGQPGAPGENGKSAYEVAVSAGFVGSESDWIASLQTDVDISGKVDKDYVEANARGFGAKGDGIANDTEAIQALFDSGREGYIPAGVYLVDGLVVPTGLKVRGAGKGKTILKNSNGHILDLSGPKGLLDGVDISNMSLDATGGHAIKDARIARSKFHDLFIYQRSPGFSIFNGHVRLLLECTFRDITSYAYGVPRSTYAWNIECDEIDGVTQNVWDRCVFWNAEFGKAGDDTQFYFRLAASGANNKLRNNTFREITMENTRGGSLLLESVTGTLIDRLALWDVPAKTARQPIIKMTRHANNSSGCQDTVIRESGRAGDGPAEGVQDIQLDSSCIRTTIDGAYVTGTGVLLRVDLGGSDARLMNMPTNYNLRKPNAYLETRVSSITVAAPKNAIDVRNTASDGVGAAISVSTKDSGQRILTGKYQGSTTDPLVVTPSAIQMGSGAASRDVKIERKQDGTLSLTAPSINANGAVLSGIGAPSGPSDAVNKEYIDALNIQTGGGAEVTEESVSRALGYVMHVGASAPAESTKYGLPVLWLRQQQSAPRLIPTSAIPPYFDVLGGVVVFPDVTGVVYKVDGNVRDGSWNVPGSDTKTVNVIAEALPGYAITGDDRWSAVVRPVIAPGDVLSTETFDGTAGQLVPADWSVSGNKRSGPQFSTPGTLPLYWYGHATTPSLVRDGSGLLLSQGGASMQTISFNPGIRDFSLEIDVAAVPSEGNSATFEVRIGSDPNSADPFNNKGFKTEVRMTAGQDVALQPDARIWYTKNTRKRGDGTDKAVGTWTWTRRGGTVTVRTPNGDTGAWNKEAFASGWGTAVTISMPASANSTEFKISEMRVKAA